jgi:AGZA family xanthine/uracil permease-like MFS transporter
MGARISFALRTPIIVILVVMSGLTFFMAQLFPWPILAAMIAYVSVGVGMATLGRVDPQYRSAVLLGFVLPTGAVVAAAVNSALPALKLSAADPQVPGCTESHDLLVVIAGTRQWVPVFSSWSSPR